MNTSGVVAEWSNAIDSKSIPFGGACSNHAHVVHFWHLSFASFPSFASMSFFFFCPMSQEVPIEAGQYAFSKVFADQEGTNGGAGSPLSIW